MTRQHFDATTPYRQLLFSMKRLRAVEETIAERYLEWKMRCPVHLSTGQEAVSAGIGKVLERTDFCVSGHRAHTHYLSKGGSLKRMLAEIYGKRTGCSSGKGGSMHLIDESVGFKGSTAIVGGTIPVGVGLGLSIALAKTKQISCVFLGDGAVEEGVFYEAVNFAVLKKLPVLFLCENNFYSVYSPLKVRQPEGRQIHEMVAGLGVRTDCGDGNDVFEVFSKCQLAVNDIRAGNGPAFLEFATYRWREHCGPNYDNDIGYRSEEEFQTWKFKDPIANAEAFLLESGLITSSEINEFDKAIAIEIHEAFEFAEASPFPEPQEAFRDLYWEVKT